MSGGFFFAGYGVQCNPREAQEHEFHCGARLDVRLKVGTAKGDGLNRRSSGGYRDSIVMLRRPAQAFPVVP